MQQNAKEQTIIRTGFEVVKIMDGDGLIVRNIFTKKEEEIRFYGVDAPEIKKCSKLTQDERETHLPGSFLITLGYKAFDYLRKKVKPGTKVTIIQESHNTEDKYGRTLAYVILPNGTSINEMMLKNGYVKAYDKIYCSKLPEYQALYLKARRKKKGLFKEVSTF